MTTRPLPLEILVRGATVSDCRKYRYQLWRSWALESKSVLFIMLNPSTADEQLDDPTIRRCIRFAHSWGYGGIRVCNLFAFRATSPKEMKLANRPVGDENDECILANASISSKIICAWGNHGTFLNRGRMVVASLKLSGYVPLHLGLTKQGQPKHPLYLRSDTMPEDF